MTRQSSIKYSFVLVDGLIYRVTDWLGSQTSNWMTRLEAEATLHFGTLTDAEKQNLAAVIKEHDAPELVGKVA